MSQLIEVKVPDIGDFSDVPVIELFVEPGEHIEAEEPICTLESDKATMDVPSSHSGTVKEVKVKLGDSVSEGTVLLMLEAADEGDSSADEGEAKAEEKPAQQADSAPQQSAPAGGDDGKKAASGGGETVEVKVPDIGDFTDVPVIDIFVEPGEHIEAEDPIVTLESDKATMDVPSSHSGTVKELKVKMGDKISEGSVVLTLETDAAGGDTKPAQAEDKADTAPSTPAQPAQEASQPAQPQQPAPQPAAAEQQPQESGVSLGGTVHASPSVRAYARELGVDLGQVKPSGPKNRVLHEDVTAFVKQAMTSGAAAGGGAGLAASEIIGPEGAKPLGVLPWPQVDFEQFGEVEVKPLMRIKKISGANLHRNWVMIPHVTQYDETDVTELENFRVELNKSKATQAEGVRYTMLAFVVKACVAALQKYPQFNSSLDGDNLVLKKYYNIGFAADTEMGLVVPVIKNADQKGVTDIAREMMELSKKARDGKLGPKDMKGGTFSISSLGGIGGTYFTPLINAPEVAILGLSKLQTKPLWDGEQFVPRKVLPLSLSYDHRIIDGAEGTRFIDYISKALADMRRTLL